MWSRRMMAGALHWFTSDLRTGDNAALAAAASAPVRSRASSCWSPRCCAGTRRRTRRVAFLSATLGALDADLRARGSRSGRRRGRSRRRAAPPRGASRRAPGDARPEPRAGGAGARGARRPCAGRAGVDDPRGERRRWCRLPARSVRKRRRVSCVLCVCARVGGERRAGGGADRRGTGWRCGRSTASASTFPACRTSSPCRPRARRLLAPA